MSYDYETQRHRIFTEQGQVLFLQIRDRVNDLLKVAGAVRLGEAIRGSTGDSWDMLACMDRMVELGELREVTAPNFFAGQFRVFVRGKGE